MLKPKFFIGPMSKNIVDAIIEFANETKTPIGLIPSRRQVERNGGYVNNWTTKQFCEYVRSKSKNILLVRDHAGPNQGNNPDFGVTSFMEDCKEDMFDIVHVDVWKMFKSYDEGLEATIDFINLGNSLNQNIQFEIGTEEAIRATTPEELDRLITDLKELLPKKLFSKVKYAVIQSGTALRGNENVGSFNQDRLIEMIKVVDKHGLISKEHNGDYLTDELVSEKFKNGLDSINIAPEFGQIETKIILEDIKSNHPEFFDRFYDLCLNSNRWVKWVPENFNPEDNKEELINICGHYIFSNPQFLKIKKKLSPDIDEKIKSAIKDRLERLVKATTNE
jgi:fructose/tagatose bisphosphate aldolase